MSKDTVEGGVEGRRDRGRPQEDWAWNLKEWIRERMVNLAELHWIEGGGEPLSEIGCTNSHIGYGPDGDERCVNAL